MFLSLLKRMNPENCFCGEQVSSTSSYDDTDPIDMLDSIIPNILVDIDLDMVEGGTSLRTESDVLGAKETALLKLNQLAGVRNNRIPIICTSKWDVILSLANCLVLDETRKSKSLEPKREEVRRLACLALNHLSIPKENKNLMVHGPNGKLLLGNITKIMTAQIPGAAYLCCICLMNLSFLKDAVETILTFSPYKELDSNQMMRSVSIKLNSIDPRDWEKFPTSKGLTTRAPTPPRQRRSHAAMAWIDDPKCLLRSLESLMRDQQPFLMSKTFSEEGEAIRWSVGLLRNLTKKNKHCEIIAKTEIPVLVLGFIERTPHPIKKWVKDSLEEMSLTVLYQLSACPESCKQLNNSGAAFIIGNIINRAGECTSVKNRASSIMDSLER